MGLQRGLNKIGQENVLKQYLTNCKSTMDIRCILVIKIIIRYEIQHFFENDHACDIMLMRQLQGSGQVEVDFQRLL